MLGSFFRSLGDSRNARRILAGNPLGSRLASRFVAGEDLDQALASGRRLVGERTRLALAFLGEHVTEPAEAREATEVYLQAIDKIVRYKLPAYVSPKPTQLGLDISVEVCRDNLDAIVAAAEAAGLFVCLDMEATKYTGVTLDLTEQLHGRHGNVGTVVQAYLFRTAADVERLLSREITVRLVKGAYNEPASEALQSPAEVETSYRQLSERLLTSGIPCAIATHNDDLIGHSLRIARAREVPLENFEFQMLYGIRRNEQLRLAAEGFNVRVYLPFGPEWFPYFMRRLGERPANLVFLLKNLVRD